MLYSIRQSKYAKALAAYFVFHLLFPVSVFESKATTNGTGSTDFSPSSFGNMVDPFSGDFNYSIPLMEVPGTGGSYPIILGYSSSSVNSEADAGWVGLGWNLNIGSVTREMKGLPDDFRGDDITKSYNMKDAEHTAFSVGANALAEMFGYDLDIPVNIQLYNNSYTGFGMNFGTSLASSQNLVANSEKQQLSVVGSLSFNYDTQKGFGFNLNYGLRGKSSQIMRNQALNVRQGSVNTSMSGVFKGLVGFGKNLNKANHIPGESLPLIFEGNTFAAKIGLEALGAHTPLDVSLSKSRQKLSTKTETFDGAGYMYLDYAQSQSGCLMDYNRENDIPVNEENKTLGVPILQPDEYFASGNDFNISFRAFRNDIGILKPETRAAAFVTGSDEAEVDPPNPTQYKLGYNDVSIITSTYSGPWTTALPIGGVNYKTNDVGPSGVDPEVVLQEPVYFKSKDDMTESNQDFINAMGGYAPSNFLLTYAGKQPAVTNIIMNQAKTIGQYSSKRVPRETYIQHQKISDITSNILDCDQITYYTTSSGNPITGTGSALYNFGSRPAHHIGKFKITSSDGVEYDYGLPVYNNVYVEAYYSTNGASTDYGNQAKVNVNTTEASVNNGSGFENLYFRNSLDPFTTNHLLTGIRGHDYVDLKNDGITDDDLGYFMKFNYTKYYDNFRWRTPYNDSYYKKGKYSDAGDDKAAFYYGNKEVYYVNSVESKTHIAIFVLQDRKDGCEPTDAGSDHEHNMSDASSGNRRLRCLDKIILYNKSNTSVPLQTVDFDYDYSLFPGAPSNYDTDGKLTLKSVTITYLENTKGTSNPYTFTYNSSGNYADMGNDRWGVPQTTDAITGLDWDNLENNFQFQGDYNKNGSVDANDKSDLNTNVSKGLLSSILLPSGGKIEVEYETDDYAYVQNKKAQQLVRILGTSEAGPMDNDPDGSEIKKADLRIYFQLPEPIADAGTTGPDAVDNAKIYPYIEGLRQVYFKTFQKLRKNEAGTTVYDYVKGYARIETDNGYGVSGSGPNFTTGYITLIADEYGVADFDVHPFRKAGWQYLRVERQDLEISPVSGSGSSFSILGEFIDLITTIPEIIGYYNACAIKEYCEEIRLTTFGTGPTEYKPSFLRLNVPHSKTGGGHRVKEITWNDNFGEHKHTMGQVYEYVKTDGTSSGVATSEPMEGKEDNVLAEPRFYTADPNSVYKSDVNFVEGPVNESYFPAPSVGYSRVVVKNIPYTENDPVTGDPVNFMENGNGIDVHEFYTCRDFPVISQYTSLAHAGSNFIELNIPKGYDNYIYNGYSQGFYCELNDMHGKPKSQATYHAMANLAEDAPVHKREYKYFTDAGGKLKTKVPVLTTDGITEEMVMGENYEFFIDMLEERTTSIVSGDQYNLDGVALIPIPSWFPTEVSENNLYRSVATNKIVHKKGILKQVVENNEGEITITDNLYFDPLTGDALLTSVNNSFNDKIYNYSYAAHWYYDAMRPMYKNTNAVIYNVGSLPADLDLANHYLHNGDRVMVLSNGSGGATPVGTVLYVHNLDHEGFDLKDVDGNAPSLVDANLRIIRSGFRNLQSVSCGSIESLKNPVTDNQNIFKRYNENITLQVDDVLGVINDFKSCDESGNPVVWDVTVGFSENPFGGYRMTFVNERDCNFQIEFESRSDAELKDFRFLSFNGSSGQVILQDIETGEVITATLGSGSVEAYEDCFKSCFTVLNAAAAEFENGDWSYNYADAGNPRIYTPAGTTTEDDLEGNGNDYHYGRAGIFRVKKNYAYQIGRKQRGTASDFHTEVDKDGEFTEFTPFDWMVPGNLDWTWAQELTRVSPYGITLETTDRSGIYACSLVGYNNKTITAQAANAAYFETAFDGFEDYAGNVYDNHGHFELVELDGAMETPDDADLSTNKAHTGKASLALGNGEKIMHAFSAAATLPTGGHFDAVTNKRYLASGWFYSPVHGETPTIKIKDLTSNTYVIPFVTYDDYPAIEDWKKLEVGFECTATHNYRIEWYLADGSTVVDTYVDDIRVHPFKAAMVSSVYDPLTLWKTAELDNQNFATFYNYDEEGNVVQVKKETMNGVVTIGTSRSNLKK